MNEPQTTESEPPRPSSGRRSFFGIILMLSLFYMAVFAALRLLEFEFPMPILYSVFFLIAVPFALVAVGIVHFVYLLRVQLGSQTARAPNPARLVSIFVGTTVAISAYFVTVYPEWRQTAAETWGAEVIKKVPPTVPDAEREELGEDVTLMWSRYWSLFENEGADAAEANPELTAVFQRVVWAVTSETMDEQGYQELRDIVPRFSRAATGPAAAAETAPAATTSPPEPAAY